MSLEKANSTQQEIAGVAPNGMQKLPADFRRGEE